VAVGYCAANVLLLPVEWLIRRHVLGMTIRDQVALLLPACHVAIWMVAAYVLVEVLISGPELLVLSVGTVLSGLTGVAVLRLAHRLLLAELIHMGNRIIGRVGPRMPESPADPMSHS